MCFYPKISCFFVCKDTNIIFKSKKNSSFFARIKKKLYLRPVKIPKTQKISYTNHINSYYNETFHG